MSYKKTMKGVDYLVQNELDMACDDNGDHFNSNHEAFSVILEEVAESKDELSIIIDCLNGLWRSVRQDDKNGDILKDIERHAKRLACEAIQVAAMARKAM
mgnify:CR=1 FL=1